MLRMIGGDTMESNSVTAVVLGGGFDTGYNFQQKDRSRTAQEAQDKPRLSFLLDKLAAAGVRRTVLCTGYLTSQIEEAFGRMYRGMLLVYLRESAPLGTGGAPASAVPHVPSDTVLVAHCDSVVDADLNEMIMHHQSRPASATVLLTRVDDVSGRKAVTIDGTGAVIRFNDRGNTGPGLVSAGVYLIERTLLQSIPKSEEISLEKEILPHYVGKGLYAWRKEGGFFNMGASKSFASTSVQFA
jgi:NDP-sugar pyrophosphorylase family protein